MAGKKRQPPAHKQAGEFWNSSDWGKMQAMAHWRGVAQWDDDTWLKNGERHVAMFRRMADRHGAPGMSERMLELGPGGGSNAVAFSRLFWEMVGADIGAETLKRCTREVQELTKGLKWTPMLIDTADPEALQGTGPFDFFLCTAVVQHMPSAEYVERMMTTVAGEMRSPDSRALVQFRTNQRKHSEGRPYRDNVARWMIFTREEFSALLDRAGWRQFEQVEEYVAGYFYCYLGPKP